MRGPVQSLLLCVLPLALLLPAFADVADCARYADSESASLLSAVETSVAPGYPCLTNETTYQGSGTMPDGPSALFFPAGRTVESARQEAHTDTPAELKSLFEFPETADKVQDSAEPLRLRALRSAATTVSFQQGARWRATLLNRACQARAALLDRLFNFQPLLLAGRVLPPVIRWTGPASTLHSEEAGASVEEAYRIARQARVVTVAPTWRDYLLTQFEAFEPRAELTPRTAAERKVWREAVLNGWRDGVQQAERVFQLNFDRLLSDYRGMLRFSMLARRGLVSLPRLAEGHLALRVGHKTLDMHETQFRITVPASFQTPEAREKSAQLDTARRSSRLSQPRRGQPVSQP